MINKALHRKRKIKQYEPRALKTGVNSMRSGKLAVHAPLLAPVVLLLNDTNIM